MRIILVIFTAIVLSNTVQAEPLAEGEKLYKTFCVACHGVQNGMDMSKRLAPPGVAVRMHYKTVHKDEASFVKAVTEWLDAPDESKTLMRGAIRRFNIMPKIPLSKEDAIKVATYLYRGELESPEGFDDHIKEMYGKQGMGKGRGKGRNRTKMVKEDSAKKDI